MSWFDKGKTECPVCQIPIRADMFGAPPNDSSRAGYLKPVILTLDSSMDVEK